MQRVTLNNEKTLASNHENRPTYEWPRLDEKPDAPAVAAARQELRGLVKPGSTVYTILRGGPSRSGMTRYLSLFVVHAGAPRNITALAARAQGDRVHDRHGDWCIKAEGCGMDMGFHEVYGLGRALYPNGFKTTEKARPRNGELVGSWDRDGGYALRQEWF